MLNNINFLLFFLFFNINCQIIFNYIDIELHLECQRVCSDLAVTQSLTAAAAATTVYFRDRFLASFHLS